MGTVYKAEGTKLERTVAIKFLPHHIAANAKERERFKFQISHIFLRVVLT